MLKFLIILKMSISVPLQIIIACIKKTPTIMGKRETEITFEKYGVILI